jgi:hypothetical protein
MEAESCPDINGTVYQSIRRRILQDLNLFHCHCDEIKRHTVFHSYTETTERSALVEEMMMLEPHQFLPISKPPLTYVR